jgi:hypothetical protein
MGLGREGKGGDKGAKGEIGPPGTVTYHEFNEPKGVIVGAKGDTGLQGPRVCHFFYCTAD